MAQDKVTKRAPGIKFEVTHDGAIKFAAAGIGEHVFRPSDASLECRHFAELKGWKSTIEDAAAKSRDPETGASAPLAERFAACVEIAKHYADKSVVVWGRKAAAASPRDDTGLVLQALMRVWGRDLDKVEALVAKLAAKNGRERDAELRDLGKAGDVLTAIGEIKAERAAASKRVSASALLAELEGEGEDSDELPEAPM